MKLPERSATIEAVTTAAAVTAIFTASVSPSMRSGDMADARSTHVPSGRPCYVRLMCTVTGGPLRIVW